MATKIQDKWVLLGLVVTGYLSALIIHKQLTIIRQIARVDQEEKLAAPRFSLRTQNAIKLDSLETLIRFVSPEIQSASSKILLDRAVRSEAVWRALRRDIAGTDESSRERALRSLNYFIDHFGTTLFDNPNFVHFDTHRAIVKCLCNLLPAARQAESQGHYHSSAEADALGIMKHLLFAAPSADVSRALRAGIVKKWLSQLPLSGEPADEGFKFAVLCRIAINNEHDDEYGRNLSIVLVKILDDHKAIEEMSACGIGPKDITIGGAGTRSARTEQRVNFTGRFLGEPFDSDEEGNFVMEELRAPPSPERPDDAEGRIRRHEESVEERSLRRRRREAMVYAETGRPIQRANIIERGDETNLEEAEEELEQLMEEITEAEAALDGHREGWFDWIGRLRPDGLAQRYGRGNQ